ncbi:MAG: lysophospholipase [Sphingomonadaceae bacterium]|nr:lysophospholipase [Sphingomonadaceae bacterium]
MIDDALTPTEQWLDGAAGRIFTRHFEPKADPRANLVICPGFNAHSGQYVGAAETFAARGFAVTAVDLRGRGKSEGERFYVDSVGDYVSDLSLAIELGRSLHPGLPVYLLGHSAGGVVSVTYALDYQDRIAGLVCEDFAFRVPAPDFALKLLEGASHVAPHAHVLRLKNKDFSRDAEWVAKLDADPLIHYEVQPIQTVAALARAAERLEREFGRITLPVLILHGTADHVTRPDGSEQFYREAGSRDKSLKLYDGYYHDLLNDVGAERVMDDILAWLDERVAHAEPAAMPVPPIPA